MAARRGPLGGEVGPVIAYGFPSIRGDVVRCDLPPRNQLFRLTRLFFDDYGYFYPCVLYDYYIPRLQNLLNYSNLRQHQLQIPAGDSEGVTLAAQMCMTLAIAEFLEGEVDDVASNASSCGRHWHLESQRLLATLTPRLSVSDNTVSVYTLEALYAVLLEQFEEASASLARAIDLALALGFNNESAWPEGSTSQRQARRTLWWTIYFLDRRFAHRFGRSFLIRDVEVSVGGFINDACGTEETMSINAENPDSAPNDIFGALSRSYYDRSWYHYLEFNIRWSRIFSKAWDALYSLNASAAGDADEIEVIEALLLKVKRQLPPELDWDVTFDLADGVRPSTKFLTRMRLIMFTVRRLAPSQAPFP
jgi:hypothetical protein